MLMMFLPALGSAKTPRPVSTKRIVVVPRSLSSAAEQVLQRQIEEGVQQRPGKVELVPWSSIQKIAATASDHDMVRPAIEAARASYLKQQFDEMQRTLSALESHNLRQLVRSPRQAAAVSLLLGVALALQGKPTAAKQRFRLARQLSAKSVLDAALYPPSVVALARQARDEHHSVTRHDLQIMATPPAQVIIDGRPSGSSSSPIPVSEGLHYVVLSRLGYKTEARLWNIRAPFRRKVTLGRLTAPERKTQLALRLRQERLPADEQEARMVAQIVGATHALLWESTGQRLTAVLLHEGQAKGRQPRAVVVSNTLAATLWRRLTRPALLDRPAKVAHTKRALWTRWWVWAVAAAVVGGAIGSTALILSAETDVQVRLR